MEGLLKNDFKIVLKEKLKMKISLSQRKKKFSEVNLLKKDNPEHQN